MTDLWPDDIATDVNIDTPLMILRQQAKFLSQRTKNIVVGDVLNNIDENNNENFIYSFRVRAPLLDNYTYELFSIIHGVIIYPLKLYADYMLIDQILNQMLADNDRSITISKNYDIFERVDGFNIGHPKDLEFALRIIFSSFRTRQIIESLIAQSKSIEVPQPLDNDEDLPF